MLGIVLLFVMAASRGWITPGMRVGIGTAVSLALLGAAIELDRRSWRSDAILSAAGVGIGGLYASLWAATSLYHLVASAAAAPLAGLIAALAVAAALRIRQEPLAVFGMSAAMLAPILVSKDVTTGGVLFGAVMVAAALPLLVRTGWRGLVASVWAIGFAETLVLLALSADHIGFGGPVVAAAVMTALVVCLTFLLELLPRERTRLSALGSLTAASAFTVTLGAAALFGGSRELDGHSLAGIALAGMTGVWLLLAFVPAAVRRPHANLADLLAGFGLTSAAIATGLLAGGPALVCAWTAESAMLVVLGERIRRRSATRSLRAIVSATAYLLLGILATLDVLQPLPDTLPHVGAGSTGGSVALVAVALAGIVLCFGLRTYARPELAVAWIVPAAGARVPAALVARCRAGRDRLRRHGCSPPRLPAHTVPGAVAARMGRARDGVRLVGHRRRGGAVPDGARRRADRGLEPGRRAARAAGPGRASRVGLRVRVVFAAAGAAALRARPARARGDAGLRPRRGAHGAACDLGVARRRRASGGRRSGRPGPAPPHP